MSRPTISYHNLQLQPYIILRQTQLGQTCYWGTMRNMLIKMTTVPIANLKPIHQMYPNVIKCQFSLHFFCVSQFPHVFLSVRLPGLLQARWDRPAAFGDEAWKRWAALRGGVKGAKRDWAVIGLSVMIGSCWSKMGDVGKFLGAFDKMPQMIYSKSGVSRTKKNWPACLFCGPPEAIQPKNKKRTLRPETMCFTVWMLPIPVMHAPIHPTVFFIIVFTMFCLHPTAKFQLSGPTEAKEESPDTTRRPCLGDDERRRAHSRLATRSGPPRFVAEVEQIQKFGENYANQLKKTLSCFNCPTFWIEHLLSCCLNTDLNGLTVNTWHCFLLF